MKPTNLPLLYPSTWSATISGKFRQKARVLLGLGLLLAVTGSVSAANLTWSGSVNNNWDTTTLNWLNGGTSSVFHNGDNVTFDNTSTVLSPSIITTVSPGSIVVNASVNYTFGGIGSISGSGGLTKSGSGTLSISTSNSYAGNTIINAGTLALTGSGSITGSNIIDVTSGATLDAHGRSDGKLTLASGQTLMGAGSVDGTVSAPAGSLIAPGDGTTGTLMLNSNLTLAGNVIMKVNGSTFTNDQITGVNNLTYGGTLTISNVGGALASGDSFNLFGFTSFSSNFASIVGSPGPGLVYSFNPSNGVLSVTNAASPSSVTAVQINATTGGNIIGVHFENAVTNGSAAVSTNYTLFYKSVAGGASISITNAVLQPDQQTVALYLNGIVPEFFAIGVSNVTDVDGNNIVEDVTGYECEFSVTNIGTSADPSPTGTAITAQPGIFQATASGSGFGASGTSGTGVTNDHCLFIYEPYSNNFDISVDVTALGNTYGSETAGLMARQSLSPGSPAVETHFTAPDASTGTNLILSSARSNANATANLFAAPINANMLNALRMTFSGGTFKTYYSTNGGSTWVQSGSTFISGSSGYVGIATSSGTNGQSTSSSYQNLAFSGGHPGDDIVPKLTAAIYQGTNLVARWPRTSRDYAVQLGTSLQTNSPVGGYSNATEWAFVILPIFDTALTGTNSAAPAGGRYMIIPMNLFTNKLMFVRLAQVDRVIPDPIQFTPGIIFSQIYTNTLNTSVANNLLCTTTVIPSTAIAQNSTPIVCPSTSNGKYSYQFTTVNSGFTNKIILSVLDHANYASTCDNTGSAGNNKAQVTLTPTYATTANYTFVAAATSATGISSNNPIKMLINCRTNF